MEHFEDFGIDYDEGRDIDPREAFYANAEPCESCGQPIFEGRKPASWDPDLKVGPCCEYVVEEIPEIPICEELYKLTMRARTVGELHDTYTSHRKVCRVCNPELPEVELREAA